MTYPFFFRHFLRNPSHVGAVIPLSQSVAKQIIKHLGMRSDDTPWRILEVGAGTGNVTKSLLAHMKERDSLDLIEIDGVCCDLLKTRFGKDKRVTVAHTSIMDWHPGCHYDFIVSTLPLNSFPPDFINELFAHYKHLASKDAICVYVEYIGVERLKLLFANTKTKEDIKERKRIRNALFKNFGLEKNKVLTNFLPCYVYHLKLHPTFTARQ